MKHLIMGTAGHVDHGKTALVKALTTTDCDTHREEKKRGITIHLGFACMKLESGENISIVDVPGHKDFIHTMVGGASGIDFVMMTIAADSGVMPQTLEHLRIMELLGVEKGLIALNRIDLVDEELSEMVCEEIRDKVAGTFLEDAPLIQVSAKTGEGLMKLREAIASMAGQVEEKKPEGPFRMYIDRIFSRAGFGTIVTGSVMNGKLMKDGEAWLLPGELEMRVRRLERHGVEVDEIRAGDRASINLTNLKPDSFERGMVVSDRLLNDTRVIDAHIQLYDEKARLGIWAHTIFHSGTLETPARVHLLDSNELSGGDTALVQIHLNRRGALLRGDKFILRATSSDRTLGGGEIIDASPLKHVRRPEKLIKSLSRIARGKLQDLISIEVKKAYRALSIDELAGMLNQKRSVVLECINNHKIKDVTTSCEGGRTILIANDCRKDMVKRINRAIKQFRRRNPLINTGASVDEIRSSVGVERNSSDDLMLHFLLEELVKKGKLKTIEKTYALADEIVDFDENMLRKISFVQKYMSDCGMKTPVINDLKIKARHHGIGESELKKICHYLQTTGVFYKVEDSFLHRNIVDNARKKLLEKFSSDNSGITVAQFRDLIDGNRKICLHMLSIFDEEGFTRRDGDYRYPITSS